MHSIIQIDSLCFFDSDHYLLLISIILSALLIYFHLLLIFLFNHLLQALYPFMQPILLYFILVKVGCCMHHSPQHLTLIPYIIQPHA